MNMNQELNFVGAFPTKRQLHRNPGVVKSKQGLLGHRAEMTRHIGARMWCQMSKGSHTFISG